MTRSSISGSLLGIVMGGMIALVACSDSTSSTARITVGRPLSLFFQAGNGAPPPPPISGVGGIGRVRVTGGYEGAACGPPRGTAHRDGNLVTLDVEAVVPNPPCDAARVVYNYDATIMGLEASEYTLEVYHRTDPAGVRRLVQRVRVTVQ